MFLLLMEKILKNQQNQNNQIKNKIEENMLPYSDKPQATLASSHGKARWIFFHLFY